MHLARLLIDAAFAASLSILPASASALQPDAPFLALKEKQGAAWSDEDKQINDKLSALRQKFGKRPNIIYILTDDVGWGELGWQGGGKHRGTPSAELDKMAFEGMRFWAAYSEPSCTPSRVAINTGRHPVRTGLTAVLWPGAKEGLSPEEVTIAIEGVAGILGEKRQEAFEKESIKQITAYIKDQAKSDNPFFIY